MFIGLFPGLCAAHSPRMALAPKNPVAPKWPVEAACPILVGHPAMMLRLEVQHTVGFWAAFQ